MLNNKYKNDEIAYFVDHYKHKDIELTNLMNTINNSIKEFNKVKKICNERYIKTIISIFNSFPIGNNAGLSFKKSFYVKETKSENHNDIKNAIRKYVGSLGVIPFFDFLKEEERNVIFVGPNGAGKTTLLKRLKKDTTNAKISYFQADRLFILEKNFSPKRDYSSFLNDLEHNNKEATSDNEYRSSYIRDQLNYYVALLEIERNDQNEKKIENGSAQKVIDEWNHLIKDRELYFDHGLKVKVKGGTTNYNLDHLSSGEKSILYFLIGILLQEEKDYYFIDEPENNLNPAIVSELWDYLENERKNSIFVYLTHDSDFVTSRINTKIYWIKKYDGFNWAYEQLKENKDLPQDLLIKLIGNREPVLFCESHDEYKYDTRLYKVLFPKYKVICAAGCDKVILLTKAYKELGNPSYAIGIIDKDYKDDQHILNLKRKNIFVLPFLEIENFILCEPLIKGIIKKYSGANINSEFEKIKKEIKNMFIKDKDIWITKNVAFYYRNHINYTDAIKSLSSVEEFIKKYNDSRVTEKEIKDKASEFELKYNEIKTKDDYDHFIMNLDKKEGLIHKICTSLKLGADFDYFEEVLLLLKKDHNLRNELLTKYLNEVNSI